MPRTNLIDRADKKETFSLRYDSRLDPTSDAAESADNCTYAEDFMWKGTNHLDGFRPVLVEFWQRRLELARKMMRIFALALDLPENYFDDVTTHPGADAVHIHYPGVSEDAQNGQDVDVGIGSHTDIQAITLLWQDMSGGLQVLSAAAEWLEAQPVQGTIVVNIGDFLERLSNNRFKSTVHRVYNRQSTSRYAMPFFLGFNPEAVCEVVPTCVDKDHPALYEPISAGKVCFSFACPPVKLDVLMQELILCLTVASNSIRIGAKGILVIPAENMRILSVVSVAFGPSAKSK